MTLRVDRSVVEVLVRAFIRVGGVVRGGAR